MIQHPGIAHEEKSCPHHPGSAGILPALLHMERETCRLKDYAQLPACMPVPRLRAAERWATIRLRPASCATARRSTTVRRGTARAAVTARSGQRATGKSARSSPKPPPAKGTFLLPLDTSAAGVDKVFDVEIGLFVAGSHGSRASSPRGLAQMGHTPGFFIPWNVGLYFLGYAIVELAAGSFSKCRQGAHGPTQTASKRTTTNDP